MKMNLLLKVFSFFLFGTLFSINAFAQKPTENRASPLDSVSGKVGKANISIKYSSPSVKGRKIWGSLVPYDQVWRAGANEATVFKTDQPITIEGKTLPAGSYSFFVIPSEKGDWTAIFNKNFNQWGAYKYDEKQDALRTHVKVRKTTSPNERLAYKITPTGFSLLWENTEIPVAIK
ncbi:DUF2911 domain-containing protein [Sporocytophaga sp.]|uniref:DUF2911 domain-containing protein n=1 Tax=Sporocytophaga sp. TaxID=2231183 RepID=UPI0025CE6131|nr:DUF2911 domain-containing protein [Sporocytophaga sp.]